MAGVLWSLKAQGVRTRGAHVSAAFNNHGAFCRSGQDMGAEARACDGSAAGDSCPTEAGVGARS